MNILITAILVAPAFGSNTNLDKEAKTAVEEFRAVYFSNHAEDVDRVVAIQQLANTPHRTTALALGELLFSAPDAHRVEAAVALGSFYGIRGVTTLASGALRTPANMENSVLRVALVNTLGSLQELGSLPILHQMVTDQNLCVALAAIKVIPTFERRESIPTLTRQLERNKQKAGQATEKRRIALEQALKNLNERIDRK